MPLRCKGQVPFTRSVFAGKVSAKLKRKSSDWRGDILACIKDLNQDIFSLNDMYQYESYLSELHPENHHIKEKIRQLLQFLRNDGKIQFLDDNGTYKKLF